MNERYVDGIIYKSIINERIIANGQDTKNDLILI